MYKPKQQTQTGRKKETGSLAEADFG